MLPATSRAVKFRSINRGSGSQYEWLLLDQCVPRKWRYEGKDRSGVFNWLLSRLDIAKPCAVRSDSCSSLDFGLLKDLKERRAAMRWRRSY